MSERNRAISASASSRYGTPSSRAFGQDRVVDVGDVAHHAHVVPELLEAADEEVVGEHRGGMAHVGRVVGRDAAHVHAHDRPDLERDDRELRGVEELDRHRRRSPAPVMRSVASPWCRRLIVSSGAATASMPTRVVQRSGVEGAQAGDAVDQVEHEAAGGVVVAGDEHVALELAVEIAERGRGDVLERGDHLGAGRGGLDRLRDRPLGGHDAAELATALLEPVRHRDDHLAVEQVGDGSGRSSTAASATVAITTTSALAASLVRARLERLERVTPAGSELAHDAGGAFRSREPSTTSWPTAASRAATP